MKDSKLGNQTILITGGTGSWGRELTRQLLKKHNPKQIRIYSRGEHKQVEMKREFDDDPRLRFIIGDVRDRNVLNFAMRDVDFVFHLAALKHVPVCEYACWEAVLTNIYGTQNVIECAIKNKVKKVIDVSTDKAVEPLNFYGMTKACGEKMMINAAYNYFFDRLSTTSFICIRGGNVIGTAGSVIPLFREQLSKKNEITITNPKMTRFLMSTREAISLIFTAIEHSFGGELFVMKMPAATLETIAKTIIRLFGNSQSRIRTIGIRPGEKIDEILVSKNESPKAYIFSEKFYVILPQIEDKRLFKKYNKYPRIEKREFSSANAYRLNERELLKILKAELSI